MVLSSEKRLSDQRVREQEGRPERAGGPSAMEVRARGLCASHKFIQQQCHVSSAMKLAEMQDLGMSLLLLNAGNSWRAMRMDFQRLKLSPNRLFVLPSR